MSTPPSADNPVIFPKPNKDGTFSPFPKEEPEIPFIAPDPAPDGTFAPVASDTAPAAAFLGKPPRHKGKPAGLRK